MYGGLTEKEAKEAAEEFEPHLQSFSLLSQETGTGKLVQVYPDVEVNAAVVRGRTVIVTVRVEDTAIWPALNLMVLRRIKETLQRPQVQVTYSIEALPKRPAAA